MMSPGGLNVTEGNFGASGGHKVEKPELGRLQENVQSPESDEAASSHTAGEP